MYSPYSRISFDGDSMRNFFFVALALPSPISAAALNAAYLSYFMPLIKPRIALLPML